MAAGAAAAVLGASVYACGITAAMPQRDLFEMGPAFSAVSNLGCVLISLLT